MLLDNRLSVTADIYQRTTRDMIGPAEAIPNLGGISTADRAKLITLLCEIVVGNCL